MDLQPLKLTAFTDKDFSTSFGNPYEAMLNPESLTWERQIDYNTKQAPNTSNPSQKYKSTPSDKLSFEIIIDCTGIVDKNRTDMKKEMNSLQQTVFTYNGGIHRPNFINVRWGRGTTFNGVLNTFNTTYTLFRPDGSPLRAKVALGFSLYVSPAKVEKQDCKESPDVSHLVTVEEGMTLPQLCNKVWNRSLLYPQVARYNDLNKFRNMAGVQSLIFPPIVQPT